MLVIRETTTQTDFHLPDNFKIRIKMSSPVFSTEGFLGGFSFPITLSNSGTNQQLLQHWQRASNIELVEDIAVDIYLGGLFWKAGTLKYLGYPKKTFRCTLIIQPSPILEELSEKNMHSFALGGTRDLATSNPMWDNDPAAMNTFIDGLGGPPVSHDFVLAPIKNEGALNAAGWLNDETYTGAYEYQGIVNHYEARRTYPWLKIDATAPHMNSPGTQFYLFCPMPYLTYVLTEMFSEHNYTISGDITANTEVQNIVLATNYHFSLWIHENAAGGTELDGGGEHAMHLKHAMPELTAIEFLLEVGKRFNAFVHFQDFTPNVQIRSRNGLLSETDYVDISAIIQDDDSTEPSKFKGRKMVYTMDGDDDELKENPEFEESLYPDVTTVATNADLAGIGSPAAGDMAYVTDENTYYKYKQEEWDGGLAWVAFAHNLYSYETHTKGENTALNISFTGMYKGDDPNADTTRSWLIPVRDRIGHEANYDWHQIGSNRANMRFLFYRGYRNDSTETSDSGSDESSPSAYPMLSNDVYEYDGSIMTGATMAERFDGDYGIWKTWYEDWDIFLKKARVSERYVRLNVAEIMHFDFTKKYRINGVDHLVEQLDFEMSADGPGLVNLKLWTV